MAFQAEKARPPIPKDQWPADALHPIARPLSPVPKASDVQPGQPTKMKKTVRALMQPEQPHQAQLAVTHKQAVAVEVLKVRFYLLVYT